MAQVSILCHIGKLRNRVATMLTNIVCLSYFQNEPCATISISYENIMY